MNGATIGVVFGCAWGIAGATALLAPWHAWAIGSSIGMFNCSCRGSLFGAKAPYVGHFPWSHLRNSSRVRGGRNCRNHLVAETVWSTALTYACHWLHRRAAFPWALEGHRPSSLSLDRLGDAPRVWEWLFPCS